MVSQAGSLSNLSCGMSAEKSMDVPNMACLFGFDRSDITCNSIISV